jgi:putative membrane protein
MTDLCLAIAHHVLVFGLAIMLAVQFALLRDGLSGVEAARLARLDIGYGASAGLIVVVGILRVIFGAKGYLYYFDNVWFWAKMATFAAVGIISVLPTLHFRMWQTRAKADSGYAPAAEEIIAVRGYLKWELRLLILIPIFAAIMARYTSL